jgi:hypothetical protein
MYNKKYLKYKKKYLELKYDLVLSGGTQINRCENTSSYCQVNDIFIKLKQLHHFSSYFKSILNYFILIFLKILKCTIDKIVSDEVRNSLLNFIKNNDTELSKNKENEENDELIPYFSKKIKTKYSKMPENIIDNYSKRLLAIFLNIKININEIDYNAKYIFYKYVLYFKIPDNPTIMTEEIDFEKSKREFEIVPITTQEIEEFKNTNNIIADKDIYIIVPGNPGQPGGKHGFKLYKLWLDYVKETDQPHHNIEEFLTYCRNSNFIKLNNLEKNHFPLEEQIIRKWLQIYNIKDEMNGNIQLYKFKDDDRSKEQKDIYINDMVLKWGHWKGIVKSERDDEKEILKKYPTNDTIQNYIYTETEEKINMNKYNLCFEVPDLSDISKSDKHKPTFILIDNVPVKLLFTFAPNYNSYGDMVYTKDPINTIEYKKNAIKQCILACLTKAQINSDILLPHLGAGVNRCYLTFNYDQSVQDEINKINWRSIGHMMYNSVIKYLRNYQAEKNIDKIKTFIICIIEKISDKINDAKDIKEAKKSELIINKYQILKQQLIDYEITISDSKIITHQIIINEERNEYYEIVNAVCKDELIKQKNLNVYVVFYDKPKED